MTCTLYPVSHDARSTVNTTYFLYHGNSETMNPIANLEEELECSICTERFNDPRFLSCHHFFCLDCLEQLGDEYDDVACPLCREETVYPKNGAAGLPKNAFVSIVVEKVTHSKLAFDNKLSCRTEDDDHKIMKQTATFYCNSCKVAICASCGMQYHRDPRLHETVPIDQALVQMRTELKKQLKWGKDEERRKEERMRKLELKQQEVTTLFAALESEVEVAIREETEKLERRISKIKGLFWEIKCAIKTALEKRYESEDTEVCISDLNSLNEEITHGGDDTLIEMFETICKDYRSLVNARNDDMTVVLEKISEITSCIKFTRNRRRKLKF